MADVSVSLVGQMTVTAAGSVKALPRPLKIGTAAMMIPPPPR